MDGWLRSYSVHGNQLHALHNPCPPLCRADALPPSLQRDQAADGMLDDWLRSFQAHGNQLPPQLEGQLRGGLWRMYFQKVKELALLQPPLEQSKAALQYEFIQVSAFVWLISIMAATTLVAPAALHTH